MYIKLKQTSLTNELPVPVVMESSAGAVPVGHGLAQVLFLQAFLQPVRKLEHKLQFLVDAT
jgi:hypothetical protein